MGKKDKKLTKEQKEVRKQQKKEKQLTKTERNEKKKLLKLKQKEEEEEDIEILIAKFKKLDEEKMAVEEKVLDKFWPSPRSHFSMALYLLKDKEEFVLFGGEYFDGKITHLYNDLFRYSISKSQWKQISSPNSPPPRCAHQTVVYKKYMYLFGGEFTSPSQNQFYHYRDFWRFNLETNQWEELTKELKNNGPSARSGHRMLVFKNKLYIFGGFYDALTTTKYFNDLYCIDLDTIKCTKVIFRPTDILPGPRSGCGLATYDNYLYLYGGYAKAKTASQNNNNLQQTSSKVNIFEKAKAVVYSDLWQLNLAATVPVWEKVKKSGIHPKPARSGFSCVSSGKKMFVFGGVLDDENLDRSFFFNDLYAFHMDTKRWFLLNLKGISDKKDKKKKKRKKKDKGVEENDQTVENDQEDENERDDENEEESQQPENKETGPEKEGKQEAAETPDDSAPDTTVSDDTLLRFIQKGQSSSNQVVKTEEKHIATNNQTPSDKLILPQPRMNSVCLISNNTLYAYGGIIETEKREVTLDDLHSLNLNSLDSWKVLMEAKPQEWLGSDTDDEEIEEGEEGEDSEDDEEGEPKVAEKRMEQIKQKKGKLEGLRFRLGEFEKDGQPVPEPREPLKDFWKRTDKFWLSAAFKIHPEERDEKALKKWAFPLCEERFKQTEGLMKEFESLDLEQDQVVDQKKRLKEKMQKKKQ